LKCSTTAKIHRQSVKCSRRSLPPWRSCCGKATRCWLSNFPRLALMGQSLGTAMLVSTSGKISLLRLEVEYVRPSLAFAPSRRENEMSEKPCSVCGDMTEYGCSDCAIDRKGFIPLCGKVSCREKHELLNPEELKYACSAQPLTHAELSSHASYCAASMSSPENPEPCDCRPPQPPLDAKVQRLVEAAEQVLALYGTDSVDGLCSTWQWEMLRAALAALEEK
jgi:hypothetical protein